jgi:integrase
LSRFVEEIGPGRPLDLLTPEDLDAYFYDLRQRNIRYADHAKRPPEQGKLSDATIYKHSKTIKVFFNWCIKRGYLQQSPARFLEIRRPDQNPAGKAATDTEVGEILGAARYKPRDWAMVLLLAQSGCRAGDVAGLHLADLELLDNSAIVRAGKGGKRRRIYFGPETSQAIQDYLEKRPDVEHDYVFVGVRGDPLTSAAVSQMIRRRCNDADLDRSLGAHAFRHYVVKKLLGAGRDPRIVRDYVGHTDVSVTMRYGAEVYDSELRDATREFSLNKQGDLRLSRTG